MNPHDIAATRSLVLLVCQFRHFRIHYENEMSFTRLFNNSKCFPNCQCSFAHFLKKIVEIIFIFLLTSYRKTDTIIFVSFELSHAGVAELADAQASGACGSNIVWVQVPSPALTGKSVNGFLFYFVQIILKAYWLLMVCNRCLLH